MAVYALENGKIRIDVESHGAELRSLKDNKNTEYMWSGDPAYWGRVSPVLFPFVGKTNGLTFRTQGRAFPMTQHGFARDMEFALLSQTYTELWLSLDSDGETLEKYPYAFRLELGYRLENDALRVLWRVKNPADVPLPFSIGGHPAFVCPLRPDDDQQQYFLHFDASALSVTQINAQGLAQPERVPLALEDGYLPIDAHLFDHDALVIEGDQSHAVSLCMPNKKPYLTVTFDAPLFGVWSPVGKHAPFVCIEPWYGRCDAESFAGELTEREWGNVLPAGGVFEASYVIRPCID